MTWDVDIPVRVGGIAFAPIVEAFVSVQGGARGIAAHGNKRPTLILTFQKDSVVGIDLSGRKCDADDIEQRYPGALSKATAVMAKNPA